MKKAIFLDRDGVINKRLVGDYVKTPEEFELLPGVKEALRKLKRMGYLLIVVSNQQGVGKGIMTVGDLERVNNHMLKLLPEIDDVFYCTELEKDNPWCRKPRPGMLLEAIKKWDIDPFTSWMVGDSESDMIAGKAVGCRAIMVENGKSKFADAYARDLLEATKTIQLDKATDAVGIKTKIKLILYYYLKRMDDYLGTGYYYIWKTSNRKKLLEIINRADKIYFDRTDLIGDAIVSIPLFFALKKMGVKFKILTSKYNDWVLNPFFETEIVVDYPKSTKLGSAITESLSNIYFAIKRKIRIRKKRSNVVLFALKQKTDQRVLKKFEDAYIVSCLGKFADFLYSDYVCNSKLFNEKHQLVESYLTSWKELGVDKYITEYPKELDAFVERVASPKIKKIAKNMVSKGNFIILFVGNKEYRRLPPAFWAELAIRLANNWNLIIIDDSGKTNKILRYILPKTDRIVYIDSLKPLWEGMYLAKYAKWVIGVDGGGFNFLQMPTNALEIILYVNPDKWKPFSKNNYESIKLWKRYVMKKTKTQSGKVKEILYFRDNLKYANEPLHRRNSKILVELLHSITLIETLYKRNFRI